MVRCVWRRDARAQCLSCAGPSTVHVATASKVMTQTADEVELREGVLLLREEGRGKLARYHAVLTASELRLFHKVVRHAADAEPALSFPLLKMMLKESEGDTVVRVRGIEWERGTGRAPAHAPFPVFVAGQVVRVQSGSDCVRHCGAGAAGVGERAALSTRRAVQQATGAREL